MKGARRDVNITFTRQLAAFVPFTDKNLHKMVEEEGKKREFKRYINYHTRNNTFLRFLIKIEGNMVETDGFPTS